MGYGTVNVGYQRRLNEPGGVAGLDSDGKLPVELIPDLDYIPESEKGKPGGVATLGSSGTVPREQIDIDVVLPQIIVTVESGSAVSCSSGTIKFTASSAGTVTFDLPSYGTWTVMATKDGKTVSETIEVDDVKQYDVTLRYFSATLAVSSNAGATVTATWSQSGTVVWTKTAVVPSSGTVDIVVDVAGAWEARAELGGASSEVVEVDTADGGRYEVDCSVFSKTLSENSWAKIAKASEAGLASSLWSIGAAKDAYTIVGFGHDDLADESGRKAGITFISSSSLSTYMDADTTFSGSFTQTDLYERMRHTMLLDLPYTLQDVIKPVLKKTSLGNGSTFVSTDEMKLFLFSEVEVCGTTAESVAGEGTQYDFFKISANRGGGWWLRSPDKDSGPERHWCYINASGAIDTEICNANKNVRYGFCL